MKTDDPKFTAYALGELDAAERAEIEQLLREDSEMANEIDGTRAFAAQLRNELRAEDSAPLTTSQRAHVLNAARPEPEAVNVAVPHVSRWGGWVLRAAACLALLAIVVGVWFPTANKWSPAARQLAERNAKGLTLADATKSSDPLTKSAAEPELQSRYAFVTDPNGADLRKQGAAAAPDGGATAREESLASDALAKPMEGEVARRGLIASAPTDAKDLKLLTPDLAPRPTNRPAAAAPAAVTARTKLGADPRIAVGDKPTIAALAEAETKQKTEPSRERLSTLARGATALAKNEETARAAAAGRDGTDNRRLSFNETRSRGYVPEQQLALRSERDVDRFAAPRPDQPRDLLQLQRQPTAGNTEAYDAISDNPFLEVRGNPLSTFSIDVDSASYANVRRFLNAGQRPPKGAVRIEELINYFSYDYPQPEAGQAFSATLEVATCPWKTDHRLLRVGLKGREIKRDQRPASNLVFLIDVSGSMQPANKLPLVKDSLRLLVDQLGGEDTVAIAVYAGASGCVLEPTRDKEAMRAAIERLEAGGSTNGASGIQLAYELAQRAFIKGGVNRVILATDGDFNVGVTSQSALLELIEEKAKSGVFLTILGFGIGNLKDSTLEKLADKGNGNYAYIDTLNEGRRVLVEQMSGTLVTIAKDVKIQVEFNPAQVTAYRLIGYENRLLRKEDFNDDTKDAGEIGAGHSVTALYEIVPIGKELAAPVVDPLKYQQSDLYLGKRVETARSKELLTLKLRHKEPEGDKSQLMEVPLTDQGLAWEKSSRDFRFAAAVASFGMLLRDSPHKGNANWDSTLELALEGKGEDASGYRAEFISLIGKAKMLAP